MKHYLKIMSLGFVLSSGAQAFSLNVDKNFASGATVESLQKESAQIFEMIEGNYGPLRYKAEVNALNWTQIKSDYLNEITTLSNTRDYYFMMSRLFSELQDAHVSVQLPSSYTAELPLQFSFVEGKTILTWVSKEGLKYCQGDVGDELLTMDGRTPNEIRLEFSKFVTVGKPRSNQSFLTMALSARNEARGLPVSDMNLKTAELRMIDQRTGATYSCVVPWKTAGVPLIGRSIGATQTPAVLAKKQMKAKLGNAGVDASTVTAKIENILQKMHELFNTEAQNVVALPLLAPEKGDRGVKNVIGRKNFAFEVPSNAKELEYPALMKPVSLLAGSGLKAFIVPYKGKRVGILRIPSYMGTLIQLIPLELRFLTARLQKESDVLLIDQTHNPGGAVAYSDWLVEAFTGRLDPAKHMKFLVRPRQGFLRQYAEIAELLKDETIIRPNIRAKYQARIQKNYDIIYKAYEEGAFLSEPVELSVFSEFILDVLDDTLFVRLAEIPGAGPLASIISRRLLDGVDITKKQVFTKPIFMMIDELDFSGGDATPAVLQDYGRVKLIGLSTAGAGGSVEAFNNFMGQSFGFHLTTSLMYRKDGVFVENVGVHPEAILEPSISDYKDGFKTYFTRVMEKTGL